MANKKENLKPFVKNDPRINRKGRPKTFDAWRALLIDLANEPAVVSDKTARGPDGSAAKRLALIRIPLVRDGMPVFEPDGVTPVMVDHYATNAEMLARQWMQDPKRQSDFVEGAYGKVPQALEHTGKDGGPLFPPNDKEADAQYNRAISSLADAIRESLSGSGVPTQGDMDTAK